MNVRSMGPISEKSEEYAMQVYLRQVWYDSRLKFNKTDLGRSEFSMNWMFAEKIWRPDTFFINGKNSYSHDITAPNMFVRLQHDGQIYMSMRLTVRASCVMHLRRFPLDTQNCPLRIASYSYNANDIVYKWDPSKTRPVSVDPDMELADYKLVDLITGEHVVKVRRIEEISTLTIKFRLNRLTGFFLLQVYVPCILIVCSSWVGFWITKKDAPGRVCLGVTTVLAEVTLGFGDRTSFPEVSYPTALDYFIVLCMFFVFASIIEFAAINFMERRANKRRKKMAEFKRKLISGEITMDGAGCIKVVPSLHTFLLETYKVHLAAYPVCAEAAYTAPPDPLPDPKGKLIQALKLPLSVVPKARDEADEKEIDIQLTPPPEEGEHHGDISKAGSESSIASRPYTPRILRRLSNLQHKLYGKDDEQERTSERQPQGPPSPSIRPLPPIPISPSTSQDSPTQDTPQMSPRMSPLLSPQTSISSATTSQGTISAPSSPTSPGPGGGGGKDRGGQPSGAVIKVEDDPPPPPKRKEDVTVWKLLLRKNYLMERMTADIDLPNEEDLLDRFSVIDLYSRRIFPTFFFVIFTIYWVLFNYYITDEFPSTGEPKIKDGLVN